MVSITLFDLCMVTDAMIPSELLCLKMGGQLSCRDTNSFLPPRHVHTQGNTAHSMLPYTFPAPRSSSLTFILSLGKVLGTLVLTLHFTRTFWGTSLVADALMKHHMKSRPYCWVPPEMQAI